VTTGRAPDKESQAAKEQVHHLHRV
jgi:hypothetical protein